jgi:DNA-binding response OmpR family regulator
MPRLLIVEDDPSIALPLERALTRDGFTVERAETGADALGIVEGGGIDLVLLDLTLPDLDGLDVCRRMRADHIELPIVMLTARADEVDLVVGFDAGADDYITKPFSLAELTARVRARLRLTVATDVVEAHGVRVDRGAHIATHDEFELQLSPKEFELLSLLVSEAGRVVPRSRIMSEVWDEHWYGPTRTLDVHISGLRRKLGDDPDTPSFITTIRGVGFRFEKD